MEPIRTEENEIENEIVKEHEVSLFVRYLPVVIIAVIAFGAIVCAGVFMGREAVMTAAMAATAIPAVILLAYIYHSDSIEPEPPGLLFALFLLGLLVSLPVMGLRWGIRHIPSATAVIVLIAISEELCKYLVLRLITWKHSAFNYRFDGVVYGATVAIGFEIAQAVLYLSSGMDRAILSRSVIPVHCIFGIYMGFFYGQARAKAHHGEKGDAVFMEIVSVIFPIVLHYTYEMLTSRPRSITTTVLFVVFIIALNAAAWISVHRFAKEDSEF
jgi:RsiW-degrading membrane proteinase PrsW (M82 family)